MAKKTAKKTVQKSTSKSAPKTAAKSSAKPAAKKAVRASARPAAQKTTSKPASKVKPKVAAKTTAKKSAAWPTQDAKAKKTATKTAVPAKSVTKKVAAKPVAAKPAKSGAKRTVVNGVPMPAGKAASLKTKDMPILDVLKTAVNKVKAMIEPAKSPARATSSKNIDFSKILAPLDDRVLVRIEEQATVTSGGLFIPDSVTTAADQKGVVVAVGRGHQNKKGTLRHMDLKVGDRVLVMQHSGSKITLEGTEFLILRESEVLGAIDL